MGCVFVLWCDKVSLTKHRERHTPIFKGLWCPDLARSLAESADW